MGGYYIWGFSHSFDVTVTEKLKFVGEIFIFYNYYTFWPIDDISMIFSSKIDNFYVR